MIYDDDAAAMADYDDLLDRHPCERCGVPVPADEWTENCGCCTVCVDDSGRPLTPDQP